MLSKKELLLVGKVVGVHGIRGELKILPYGDCEKKPWKKLYLAKANATRIGEVRETRPHKGVIITSLTGYDDRNRASELIGFDVYIDKKFIARPPKGEYYHFQLEGMEVVTDDGTSLGVITHIFSAGGNDIYVVNGPLGEVLIPAIRDVVRRIDVRSGKMVVHLLEGLLPDEQVKKE